MKRAFDLLGCLVALPLFGPLALVFAWLVRREDGGPVFFIQERLGLDSRPFRCFKFRTMREGHVTQVGSWLRSTGLDEIGQFLNVLRGEMSVVGPRPLTRADIERLDWKPTDRRFRVRPGITGLAQLHSGTSARRSLACDRYYAAHSSLWLDIQIVLLSFVINAVGKKRFRQWRSR